MQKQRKTIPIEAIKARGNHALANSEVYLPDGITPEQAWRMAIASMLEFVLFDANAYRGFGYLDMGRDVDFKLIDETRRVYY